MSCRHRRGGVVGVVVVTSQDMPLKNRDGDGDDDDNDSVFSSSGCMPGAVMVLTECKNEPREHQRTDKRRTLRNMRLSAIHGADRETSYYLERGMHRRRGYWWC
jgi:hypothetical protein